MTASPSGYSRIARRIRVPLGFAFAIVYLWLARPSGWSIAASLLVVVPGLWLRAIAAGHVKKNAELTTTGPYAYTRNPLYLGSVLIAIGFAVAARSLWVGLVLVALFFAIYIPVIKSEEEFLRATFPEFDSYSARVPRLFPKISADASPGAFESGLYRRHREYNALIGALFIYLALIVKLILISRT
ncbi:MAG TPA: isoprenylcysteine carboxylmethyltransferase family protein [Terriglobales bacterium]|nr:isoprenylcysteine carboxylmethyltransferase family protein [Terriglobales bacterium]